jgi:hypothetical protein
MLGLRIGGRTIAALAVVSLIAGLGLGWGIARAQHTHQQGPGHVHGEAPVNWLVGLKADARIPAIQRQLRGFETTMAEVAYRYTELYFGAQEGNWQYAGHMAMTLDQALRLGLEREPARRANAENLFLKGALPGVMEAIRKQDAALFKERFETMRAACTACHAAEQHAFIKIGLPVAKRNPVVN